MIGHVGFIIYFVHVSNPPRARLQMILPLRELGRRRNVDSKL